MGNKLPGDYIAGFVDGEGCFSLKFRRDVRKDRINSPEYYYWTIEFAILLKSDDKEVLKLIRNTLDCGNISINKNRAARYSVSGIDDLFSKIKPFFSKYKLRAKKKFDYILWSEALDIFKRNQDTVGKGTSQKDWSDKDQKRLFKIHSEMSKYKGGAHSSKWI